MVFCVKSLLSGVGGFDAVELNDGIVWKLIIIFILLLFLIHVAVVFLVLTLRRLEYLFMIKVGQCFINTIELPGSILFLEILMIIDRLNQLTDCELLLFVDINNILTVCYY